MSRWWAVAPATLVVACTTLLGDLDRIVAIELVGSRAPTVEEGDVLQLQARALRANGAVVPDAEIVWALLDVDSGQVGFTLDATTGLVAAVAPGKGRVQARVDNLTSGAITVTVTPAPDSVAAGGDQRLVFAVDAESSPPLQVVVFDLTTNPGQATPLGGKPVTFALTDPPPGSDAAAGFFLTVSDVVPGTDPHVVTATTGTTGVASVVVRLAPGALLPDSAAVAATARTALGAAVVGSPVSFTVIFP